MAGLHPTPDTGVLVLQMGGPATLADVRPFLRRMLSDRAVVALPGAFRIPLAFLVSWTRARRVRRQYEAIGGGSPITRISLAQAARLEEALNAAGHSMPVLLGQRHAAPTIREAVDRARGMGIARLVLLPLYPQFSETTTGSALREAGRFLKKVAPGMRLRAVRDYADHPAYARAVADTVREALDGLSEEGRSKARVLFSAHGLPVRYVSRGDPYPDRVAATVRAVVARVGERMPGFTVCYQSRVGPVRWLGPSTREALGQAAREGVSAVVLVPISFVSDHLETLFEMDIQYREEARLLGIREVVRARSLNDSRAFASALAQIVVSSLASGPDSSLGF